MTRWHQLDPQFPPEGLGYLWEILRDDDKRPIKEQLEDRYRHGGGWRPLQGFKMLPDQTLIYPGDPPFTPSARAVINDETLVFYRQCSLLAVIQPNGSWVVTRVD